MTATIRLKGGEGSGNFDHAGRPGKVGGSAPASYRLFQDYNRAEMYDFLAANSGVSIDKLHDKEWAGVKWYLGQGYFPINSYLRHGKIIDASNSIYDPKTLPLPDAINSLDKFTNASITPEDIIVHRGFGPKTFKDIDVNTLIGTTISDKGYASASLDSSVAKSEAGYSSDDEKWHGSIAEIRVPKGTRVGMVNSGEYEIIFPRGTRFEVIDVIQREVKNPSYYKLPSYNEVKLILQVVS